MVKELSRFVGIVARLRRECPWDRKQTHRSLIRYLVEEAYETIDAIESRDRDALREELGDLLLQVVLHAEIAKDFDLEAVAKGISDKMVRRHPHVFEPKKENFSRKDHQKRWTELKRKEKPDRGLLDGIPRALPGLNLSQRYGEIAATVGFDWKNAPQVFKKVREEMGEMERELKKKDKKRIAEEMGDLFFALANLARHLGLDADAVARDGAKKFGERFRRLERMKKKEGKTLVECSGPELEKAWDRVKRLPS